jgi:hypothetical protein
MNIRHALLALLLTSSSFAQVAQPTAAPNQTRLPGGFTEEVEWPTRLAMRTQFIRGMCPISKKVVLVPDAATYLSELQQWTRHDRWPVLFEDSFYAPMFIRRFQPEVIYRRASVGTLPATTAAKRELVQRAVALAWRKDESTATTPKQAFAERKFQPVGVVVTSMSDPAWTAAVALAAAHGQFVVWLDEDWGAPNDLLEQGPTRQLMTDVNTLVNSLGVTWNTIGDAIELLTVCKSLPARCTFDSGPAPEGMPAEAFRGPRALSDCLGRNLDGTRWAFGGWIFGGKTASAYIAMSSYFLPRDRIWLGNTYPDEGQWRQFGLAETARLDTMFKYDVTYDESLTLAQLQKQTSGGLTTDMVMMTSKGNADFFDLGSERVSPYEVPLLNTPAMLYLLHSWSMKTPGNLNTVGGRWLRNGVYAFAGSSHEPLLSGFVPPTILTRRLLGGIPFGAAVRYWPGESPLAMPWRINVFGDPFIKSMAPQKMGRPEADIVKSETMVNLEDEATARLDAAVAAPSDATYASAISLQTLIGNDTMAVGLWNRAGLAGVAGHSSATAALGSLFRKKKETGFAAAFERLDRITSRDRDMLWSLLGPGLASPQGRDYADLLDRNVRKTFPAADMKRLAPVLAGIHGNAYVSRRLDELRSTAINLRERKALDALQSKY